MRRDFGWAPRTPVEIGVPAFIDWWRQWVERD
jgi:nucleoside-diphosphate-sugar epimerase